MATTGRAPLALLLDNQPSNHTPEVDAEAACAALRDRMRKQELARQTRAARRDLVLADDAFTCLGLLDPERHIRDAIACYPRDAIVVAIAIFSGKRTAGTLPDGVDARAHAHSDMEPSADAGGSVALEVEDLDALSTRLKAEGVRSSPAHGTREGTSPAAHRDHAAIDAEPDRELCALSKLVPLGERHPMACALPRHALAKLACCCGRGNAGRVVAVSSSMVHCAMLVGLGVALLSGCAGPADDPLAGGIVATFRVSSEEFRIWVTAPGTIDQLLALEVGQSHATIPSGRVVRSAGEADHNTPWSWHVDPEDVVMTEVSIELCDGTPSYLEQHLDDWIEHVVRYCPWGASLVDLDDHR